MMIFNQWFSYFFVIGIPLFVILVILVDLECVGFLRSKKSWVKSFQCPECSSHPRLQKVDESALGFERIYYCIHCNNSWTWAYIGEEIIIEKASTSIYGCMSMPSNITMQ